MKKKILIISIAVNVLVGAFVLMGFNSKRVAKDDTIPTNNLLIIRAYDFEGKGSSIEVYDENKLISNNKVPNQSSVDKEGDLLYVTLAKTITNYQNQGYLITLGTSETHGWGDALNVYTYYTYILEKK